MYKLPNGVTAYTKQEYEKGWIDLYNSFVDKFRIEDDYDLIGYDPYYLLQNVNDENEKIKLPAMFVYKLTYNF